MDEATLLQRLNAALTAHASDNSALAEQLCQEVLAAVPERPEALTLLGILRRKNGQTEAAEALYRRALAVAPHYADAHHNLGNLLLERGLTADALGCFQRSVALRPDWSEGHNRMGATLHALGRFDEAFAHFNRALELRPDNADSHWDYALALLAAGHYQQGWQEYEWRWRRGQPAPRPFSQPRWNGEPLEQKRILVYVEQGYGDAIQFLRFLPLLKAHGGHIILEIHAPLAPLLDSSLGIDEIVLMGAELPTFDVHVPLLSLPGILGITLDNLPRTVPYLRVSSALLEKWQPRLENKGLKVGIVWAGNPNVKNDRWRSPRLKPLLELFDTPGVQFYALQKGAGSDDLQHVPPLPSLTNLGPDLQDFGDTAAIILHLDLVITTDTSVAHLAGALGKPVWIMLHAEPDWRWLRERDDNPWYPTARLYRQARMGDWSNVAQAVRNDLHQLAQPESHTTVPLRQPFTACPLCQSTKHARVGEFDCRRHALWHPPLPETLIWLRCQSCGHVHTDSYYTGEGFTELFRKAHAGQVAGGSDFDSQRFIWSRVVEQVLAALPDKSGLFSSQLSWLDVGCGSGGLVFTAAEYGFSATGLDAREETVTRLAALGYPAICGDLMSAPLAESYSVISMADVLEHIADPKTTLARVHQLLQTDGALFISCPNLDSASWKAMDMAGTNPYWGEIEHLHNFSRQRLMALLQECGFMPLSYGISQRYKACMEIVARRLP